MSELPKNITKLTFRVYKETEGGFYTKCVEFPGIITEGDTEDELRKMILDVLDCYFNSFPNDRAKISDLKNNQIEVTVS